MCKEKKRRAMYKRRIVLSNGVGTLAVMEWIKSHPSDAYNLDHTFFFSKSGAYIGVCSVHLRNTTLEKIYERDLSLLKRASLDIFEYKGMYRYCAMDGMWYFEIDGTVYLFTD